MLWSRLFIPTLREDPAEAEVASHRLLLRAGYIRQLAPGVYSYLYLAQRSLLKIQRIVREEMDSIGAQEMLLPALNPAEIREEAVTSVARGELRSYKQLPQIWYQIQTKFRDEPEPKAGLLGAWQFLMKDSYSFDLDAEGLDASFRKHHDAYLRILARCGVEAIQVEAHSGATEFMAPSEAGEDLIAVCQGCRYAAVPGKAISRAVPPAIEDPDGKGPPEEFHTPGRKTIAEVSEFTGLPPTSQMKSLVMVAGDQPVLALVRGDHHLSETKLAAFMGAGDVRPATWAEIGDWFGAAPGSLGPVGITKMRVLTDFALEGRRNMIAGANRDDYHLRGVTPGRDFQPEFADLRRVSDGEGCAVCGAEIKVLKAIEAGHIVKLGYKYSEAMGLRVLAANGAEIVPIMGSYGIGIERLMCASIEQNHDANGMSLPAAIAPFAVVITPVNNGDASLREAARAIYAECRAAGIDALYDDRDERPGVKFKDSELIGVPWRITIGKKLAEGMVELVSRRSRESRDVPIGSVVAELREAL